MVQVHDALANCRFCFLAIDADHFHFEEDSWASFDFDLNWKVMFIEFLGVEERSISAIVVLLVDYSDFEGLSGFSSTWNCGRQKKLML